MPVDLTPKAKITVEFPDGPELTFWVKDLKIDPPGMERDTVDAHCDWDPSMKLKVLTGITRLTDGRIEATISATPEGHDTVFYPGMKPSTPPKPVPPVSYPRLENQLKESEAGREYWKEQALILQKEKDLLQRECNRVCKDWSEMRKIFHDQQMKIKDPACICSRPFCNCENAEKMFTPSVLRKEEWQMLDNAILAAASSRLREWKEDPPKNQPVCQLPWFERVAKRAIELIVDFFTWVW